MTNIFETMETVSSRDRVIIRTSLIGIFTNVLLAVFKAVIGVLSNSIAVTLDAVNNLSDALSSIITIVGTKLAGKLPDKKHPLGHGRIEYLSAMIVSGIVLYAGITSAVESVKEIIDPETPVYSAVSLIIMAVAVVVKILLGRYVKAKGQQVNSGSLIASGSDALFDAVLSASVLLSAVIFLVSGVSLEAAVGLVISIFITRSGIGMMKDTLDDILGIRADRQLTKKIKDLITEDEDVHGAFDLFMFNYGPDRNFASVHVELPDTMTVREVDRKARNIRKKVFHETGVLLTGIGVYSYNTGNTEAAKIQNDIYETVLAHDWVIQVHGFYLDTGTREIRFDVVISFDIRPEEGYSIILNEMKQKYPDHTFVIALDTDISD